ncbi:phosphomannomutase [Nematocida homosporus]|uniref:phosphomannomutase n=1 Tax=Nematocida homosporus TaxID=1912981 RepID=UPI00221F9649|nr:phosphomannomutase [Nematocida homosporus]KAI5184995.1 phosphomannomutase [Nematocida homosporus]
MASSSSRTVNLCGGKSEGECRNGKILFLFDVDGTLTASRGEVKREMVRFLAKLRCKVLVGFVGGSDLEKQKEQLGSECLQMFDYCFPENGLHYIKNGVEVSAQSYIGAVGEEEHLRLVNKILKCLSEIDLPVKRGTFIEYRNCILNVSPIGRSCSQAERKAFAALDKERGIRAGLVAELSREFPELTFSIGGEISIDIFPKGWDKTYCLSHLEKEGIDKIYFFGDMTQEGGNDFEIARDERVVGTTVTSPENTMEKVQEKLHELGMSL